MTPSRLDWIMQEAEAVSAANLEMFRRLSRLRYVWVSMHQRCINKAAVSFKNYGGRGIAVCPRWASFDNFAMDMGLPPKAHSLDRIDNDRGYQPDNCRWATRKKQNNNRRTNVAIVLNGERLSLKEYCLLNDLPYGTIRSRINCLKWPIERAVSAPIKSWRR